MKHDSFMWIKKEEIEVGEIPEELTESKLESLVNKNTPLKRPYFEPET